MLVSKYMLSEHSFPPSNASQKNLQKQNKAIMGWRDGSVHKELAMQV